MSIASAPGRWLGVGTLATGIVCPCHVLVGVATLLSGNALLSPAAQDGVHAAYVPLAAVLGALLLRGQLSPRQKR